MPQPDSYFTPFARAAYDEFCAILAEGCAQVEVDGSPVPAQVSVPPFEEARSSWVRIVKAIFAELAVRDADTGELYAPRSDGATHFDLERGFYRLDTPTEDVYPKQEDA